MTDGPTDPNYRKYCLVEQDKIVIKGQSMTDALMYIPNDDTQNYFYCRLQLVVKTFGHSNNQS